MGYRVSLQKCDDYSLEHLLNAIGKNLEPWGGMRAILQDKESVLLKLNLLGSAPPEAAVTTHPAFLEAVIALIQEEGINPLLGDSPGGVQTSASFQRLLTVTGIARVAQKTGCRTLFFNEDTTVYQSELSRTFKKFQIPRILTEVDAVIGLPRFKTHQLTTITGAVKLLYGYLPGSLKAEYHLHTGKNVHTFAELLCDLYATFPPVFSLMDAVVAMEGNGPRHGSPRHLGLILASPSSGALDYVMSYVAGFDPMRIPTVAKAAERGLGPGGLQGIEICGEPLEALRCHDFCPPDAHRIRYVPEFLFSAAQAVLAARPVINPLRCRSCGVCELNCPSRAIFRQKDASFSIHSSRCIRCFCCQELCPEGAVEIYHPFLRRVLKKKK
jgi:uncharacterized protein (DUF362 family)/ferredoxin-like protein FixX